MEAPPGIAALRELVPGYAVSGWQGVGAPRNTPGAIIGKRNREINAGLADPAITTRLTDLADAIFFRIRQPILGRSSPPRARNLAR